MREDLASFLPPKDQVVYKTVFLLAPVLEVLAYGVYLHLCIVAFPRLVKKEARETWPERVSLVVNVLMFILATAHGAVSCSQMLVGFGFAKDVDGPLEVFDELYSGVSFIGIVILLAMLTTGESFMIYRCFLLWQRQYWVIGLPIILSLLSFTLQMVILHRSTRVVGILDVSVYEYPLYVVPFALHSAQSVVTTGMIVFRVWSQLRGARNTATRPPRSVHVPSFEAILRIMGESAMIYTFAMLAMVVLVFVDHPGQYIVYCCLAPTTGITFVLLAMRTRTVREEAKKHPLTPSGLSLTFMWGMEKTGDARAEQAGR